MRDANFFVTTGEILITNYPITGSGNTRTLAADVEWTYPPSFMEIVMGDGTRVTTQRISMRDLPALGATRMTTSLNVTGMAWVRMSIWDVATNGAFGQPVWLTSSRTPTK